MAHSIGIVHHKTIGDRLQPPEGSKLHNNSIVYWVEWGVNEFVYLRLNASNIPDSVNPPISLSGLIPYCMRLNIAVTPYPPGPPNRTIIWPQEIVVDWVRVYHEKKSIITKNV